VPDYPPDRPPTAFVRASQGRSTAPAHRTTRAAVRDAVAWLACAACVSAGAAGCRAAASGSSGSPTASASSGCAQALHAVSSHGPTVMRDAVGIRKIQDTVEIDLLVIALDGAARAVGDPAAKQSIANLASAYERFRDDTPGAIAPLMGAILADTRRLDLVCGS
jgi:hypothetical protein